MQTTREGKALGLTTFLDCFHGVVSAQHGLQLFPSFPEDLPTGWMVVLSILVAAKSSEGVVKLMYRPVRFDIGVPPRVQYSDVIFANPHFPFAPGRFGMKSAPAS